MEFSENSAREGVEKVLRVFESLKRKFHEIGAAAEAHHLLQAFGETISTYESGFTDLEIRAGFARDEIDRLKSQSGQAKEEFKAELLRRQIAYTDLMGEYNQMFDIASGAVEENKRLLLELGEYREFGKHGIDLLLKGLNEIAEQYSTASSELESANRQITELERTPKVSAEPAKTSPSDLETPNGQLDAMTKILGVQSHLFGPHWMEISSIYQNIVRGNEPINPMQVEMLQQAFDDEEFGPTYQKIGLKLVRYSFVQEQSPLACLILLEDIIKKSPESKVVSKAEISSIQVFSGIISNRDSFGDRVADGIQRQADMVLGCIVDCDPTLESHHTDDQLEPTLTEYLFKDPSNTSAKLILGSYYLRSGEHEKARKVLHSALKADPNFRNQMLTLAEAYSLENTQITEYIHQIMGESASTLLKKAKETESRVAKAEFYEISGRISQDPYTLYRAARNYQQAADNHPNKVTSLLQKSAAIYQEIADEQPKSVARLAEVRNTLQTLRTKEATI